MAVKTVGQTSLTCHTSYKAQKLVANLCFWNSLWTFSSSNTMSRTDNQHTSAVLESLA